LDAFYGVRADEWSDVGAGIRARCFLAGPSSACSMGRDHVPLIRGEAVMGLRSKTVPASGDQVALEVRGIGDRP